MAGRTLARRIGRTAGWTLGAGTATSAGTFAYLWATDTGFERSVRFWTHAGPILAHYWWEDVRSRDEEDKQARYKRLHAIHAPDARRAVEDLRGMFVKVGQVLSVRPEAIPDEYRQELQKMQDCAPATRWESVKSTLERELGAPIDELFEHVDEEPLGAASIGQAHLASWRGRQVVVKVQYPDAAAMLHADFNCLETLLWLMGKPDTQKVVTQIRQQFAMELDYVQEAMHLRSLHDTLAQDPAFRDKVVVPEPIEELTRGCVIGMEYLPGEKLELALRQRLKVLGLDVADRPISEWLMDKQRNHVRHLESQPDTASTDETHERIVNVSPSWPARAASLAMRFLGADLLMWVARLCVDVRLNLGSLVGRRSDSGRAASELRQTLRVLLAAHGFQLFFCQYFNADPHPGNILLLPDGRVGLIDFGQCRRLSHDERVGLARLFVALGDDRRDALANERLARAFSATGVKTEKSDERVLALMPRLMFDKVQPEWLSRDGPIRKTFREDRVETFPIHLAMAYRTSMLLRGLCLVLQENVSIADEWRPWAERWLSENGIAVEADS